MAKIIEINGKKYEAVKDEKWMTGNVCDWCAISDLCNFGRKLPCEDENGNANFHFKLLNE